MVMSVLTAPVDAARLIDMPGLVWRQCRFQTCDVTQIHDVSGMRLNVPPDLIGAVPKRRSEFLAGRLCAALALAELGAPTHVGRKGRVPLWPSGFCGSISHSEGRAICCVMRGDGGVGVDCEKIIPPDIARDIAANVLAPGDEAYFTPDLDFARNLTLTFAAKEAAYKAVARHLHQIPDFTEARIGAMSPDLLVLDFHERRLPVRIRLDGSWAVALCLPNVGKKGGRS